MSSQKFKTNSFCVEGRHRFGAKDILGEITFNKKTGNKIELLVEGCVIGNKRKSMSVSDNKK